MADETPTTNPAEEWRPIEGWPYEVSNLGRVRRATRGPGTHIGKILANLPHGEGYHAVCLYVAGRSGGLRHTVHRLVCGAFHGTAPSPKHQVAHGDNDRKNNRANNLRWALPRENAADKVGHGTHRTGDKMPWSKLDATKVREIRALRGQMSQKEIGRRFGVCQGTVSEIQRREIWRQVE